MHKLFRVSALAALALGASALTAQAQGAKTFGLVAGVDFSTLSGSDASDNKSKTGFMGGLFVAIPVGARMAVEPEVLYSMKGSKFGDGTYDETLTLDYIEIPVLFKYNFNDAGGPYLLAGPAVNFNVTCKDSFTPSGGSESSASCSDLGVKANTTFGGVVGLGFSRGRLGIEGRYDFDFTDAIELDDGTTIDAKNGAWAILLRLTK
jgi:hypothetical protein